MEDVIVAVATLLGALVGAGISWVVQRQSEQHANRVRAFELRHRAYSAFLAAAHERFLVVEGAYKRGGNVEDVKRAIATASPAAGQLTLEDLSLIASAEGYTKAHALWDHLRIGTIATGGGRNEEPIEAWRQDYWRLRHDLLREGRRELAVPA